MSTALTASLDTAKYRYKVSPCCGRDRTGGCESARLRCRRACSHSSFHSKVGPFLSNLKKGRACCADLATNRDSEVSMPFRIWMDLLDLGVGSSENARHLSGLASIPRSVR